MHSIPPKILSILNENTTLVFPAFENIFTALELCPLKKVRVVILGQDPYHDDGQAHGLAFSVQADTALPPSLQNILKEVESDLGHRPHITGGNLTPWAEQGVLLLNTVLTVEAHHAGSHRGKGWEKVTDNIITELSNKHQNIIFMLWGNDALKKRIIIDETKHLVLTAPHPSPLSAYRGFFGCKHFSKANEYLQQHYKEAVVW